MLFNVVLVSAVEQSGSAVHASPRFHIAPHLGPHRALIEFPGPHTGFSWFSVLGIVLYMCQSQAPSSFHSAIFPSASIYLFPMPMPLSGRLRLNRCRLSSLRKGKENGVLSYTSLSLLSPLVLLPWNFCPYIFLLTVSPSGILQSTPCSFCVSHHLVYFLYLSA